MNTFFQALEECIFVHLSIIIFFVQYYICFALHNENRGLIVKLNIYISSY